MCNKQNRLRLEVLPDGTVEDVVAHVGIQGTEGVIQDVDAPVTIQGAGKADPLALSTTQVGSSLSNL